MIARALLCVLAAVIAAGLVSTPQSTVVDDALRGLAVGATLLLPIALLYAAARSNGHHRRHQAGRARLAVVLLSLVLSFGGLVVSSCRPNLPPVSGCTPYTRRCSYDYTEICSASRRWERDGDLPCYRIGLACIAGACVDPPDASPSAESDASTDGGAR